jgi:hypothetical protein
MIHYQAHRRHRRSFPYYNQRIKKQKVSQTFVNNHVVWSRDLALSETSVGKNSPLIGNYEAERLKSEGGDRSARHPYLRDNKNFG